MKTPSNLLYLVIQQIQVIINLFKIILSTKGEWAYCLFYLTLLHYVHVTASQLPHEAQNDPLSNVCHCVLGIVTKYHTVYY